MYQKKARINISISDKSDFRTKNIFKDKEDHYIMTQKLILQEDITVTVCMPLRREHQDTECKTDRMKKKKDKI